MWQRNCDIHKDNEMTAKELCQRNYDKANELWQGNSVKAKEFWQRNCDDAKELRQGTGIATNCVISDLFCAGRWGDGIMMYDDVRINHEINHQI